MALDDRPDSHEMLSRAMMEAFSMGGFLVDAEGRIHHCDGPCLSQLGLPVAVEENVTVAALFSEQPEALAAWRDAVRGTTGAFTISSANRQFSCVCAPVATHPDASTPAMTCTFAFMETTEAFQMRGALQEEAERLHGLVSSAPGVIYQFIAHADGRMEFKPVEEQFKALFGVKPVRDSSFDYYLSRIVPEDREPMARSIAEAIREVKPWRFEGRFIARNGGTVWFRGASQPQRCGEDLIFNGILVDVSREKNAEQAARESEERFKTLFDLLPYASVLSDADGRFRIVNDAFLHYSGCSREEVIGKTPSELGFVPFEDFADFEMLKEKLHSNGILTNEEAILKTPSGKVQHLLVSSRLVQMDGQPHSISAILDISNHLLSIAALEEARAQLKGALTQSPLGIIIGDIASHRIVLTNAKAYEILGAPPESADETGADFFQIPWSAMHPDGTPYPADEMPLARANRNGEVVVAEELLIRHASGAVRRVSANAAPIRNRNGEITAGIVIFQDITDRWKAGEQLRLNEMRVQSLLRLNQMTHVSFKEITDFALEEAVKLTNSTLGYLAFLNEDETVLTMHSWSKSAMAECQVMGKPLVYPLETTGLWGEAVRQRKPVFTNDYAAPNPYKKGYPEGHVAVLRHLNVPVFSSGRIVALVGVGNKETDYDDNDVNQLTLLIEGMWSQIERRRTHEAILESEERFRYLADAAFEGIFVHRNGVIIEANKKMSEIFGYASPQQMIGLNCITDLLPPMSQPGIQKRIETNEVGLHIMEGKRADGTIFPCETQARVILFHGEPARVAAIRDISERTRLEAQLLQVRKLETVGQLAGGIAHDFNNILAAILGFAELELLDIPPDHPHAEAFQEIVNAGNRGRDLTRQLLAFARKQTLDMKPMELDKTIAGFEKMLRRTLREDISLTIEYAPKPYSISGDAGQIEQVLLNLALNAQDAMPQGGALHIGISEVEFSSNTLRSHEEIAPGAYCMLSVSDTGMGIEKEIQGKIFEPFFTTKALGKGTGLGLATVYGIVRQHQGFINLYSELGKGTVFRIYFPKRNAESHALPALKEIIHATGGQETILLVEDEKTVREITTLMLRRLGYKTLVAQSGLEALALSAEYQGSIDLLLSDVIMPDLNGKELYVRLSASRPALKVLYMSGYTADVIGRHGILDEGVQLINKPFSIQGFAKRIRDMFE